MKDFGLEIARLIGEPIDTRKRVPVALEAVADTYTAEPGEHVWVYSAADTDPEYILQVDGDGVITPVKVSPLDDTELTFKHLNSRMEYVLVSDILDKPDTQVLARKKSKITKGMDKRELQILFNAITGTTDSVDFSGNVPTGAAVQTRDAASGEDLYDVIIAMKHKVEDYGDNYVLLVGSTVKENLDTYDKDNVGSFNYRIGIYEQLERMGVKVTKVFGKVKSDRTSPDADEVILDAKAMILVAIDSTISEGKPVKFVRRRISPDIAKLMGADVDNAQRAIITNRVPTLATPAGSGATFSNLYAFGVYGAESFVLAITNGLAIVKSDCNAIL